MRTSAGTYVARVLIAGAGPLHEPRIPDLPGLGEFEGTIFHSARWRHDHDLRHRRVAVVGTGSSAIQFLPQIAPLPDRLTLFQRTAPWVLPKFDRRIPAAEQALYRRFPATQRAMRAFVFRLQEGIGYLERREALMARVQRPLQAHLERQVSDPELRRICTPAYTLGCKRILLSNDWYPALQRPNVDVVPHGVERLTPGGIVGTDGVERPVDTVILGTGFHVTDPPLAPRVRGAGGHSLADAWAGSPRAYLGTTVAGFPNLFLLVGPNLANGHSSVLLLVEAQLRYVMDALRLMRERDLTAVDVRAEVVEAHNAAIDAALVGTVWNAGGCSSYYVDANGRNATILPWPVPELQRRLARFDAERYELLPTAPVSAATPT